MLTNAIAADRSSRWSLASEIIESWFGPAPTHAHTRYTTADLLATERRLGVGLPEALHEWYLTVGARPDVWNIQDSFVAPKDLRVVDGWLVIFHENQNVVQWGLEVSSLREADPPVLVSDPSDSRVRHVEARSLTEFALQRLALDAKFSALDLFRANGQVPNGAISALEQLLPRLPFPDLHWPLFPARLYGNAHAVIEIDGETWLWVTARDESAFEKIARVAEDVGVEWESLERGGNPEDRDDA